MCNLISILSIECFPSKMIANQAKLSLKPQKKKILNLAAASACPTSWMNTNTMEDRQMYPMSESDIIDFEICRKAKNELSSFPILKPTYKSN